MTDTRVPWVSKDDSAHNYILQPEGWRRASGGVLRAHKAFLHTDAEVGETIDARLDQLIDQELDSFQLTDSSSFFRLPSYAYFLLGVATYFLCWWVIRARRKRR